ncbi:MAG: hypothetical protein [Microvirus sp.]|nr:MAG: hypothetical protein [Microvirus sp.]
MLKKTFFQKKQKKHSPRGGCSAPRGGTGGNVPKGQTNSALKRIRENKDDRTKWWEDTIDPRRMLAHLVNAKSLPSVFQKNGYHTIKK